MRAEEEIRLAGGDVTEGVVRVGDTVRRPRGAWSDAVAAYLRHLEAAGFDGAPRWHGVDERGRDVLDFVPGEVPSQPVVETWAAGDDVLAGVASLLRRLHAASAGFVPPAGAVWFGEDIGVQLPAGVTPDPPADIVSHFDVTPQNVVFHDGTPVALIDFDLARPGSALVDVINTARWCVPSTRLPTATPPSQARTSWRASRPSSTRTGSTAAAARASSTCSQTAASAPGTG